jgi:hypothetical protein
MLTTAALAPNDARNVHAGAAEVRRVAEEIDDTHHEHEREGGRYGADRKARTGHGA